MEPTSVRSGGTASTMHERVGLFVAFRELMVLSLLLAGVRFYVQQCLAELVVRYGPTEVPAATAV